MNKQDKFEQLIWEDFKDNEDYHKTKHRFLRIRKMMLEHPSFGDMAVMRQYNFCATIMLIAIQTSTKDLRQFRMTADRNALFPYSIDEYYQPPDVVDIAVHKRISLPSKASENEGS